MGEFGEYASVYDLVYGSKDYAAECDFLQAVWRRWSEREVGSVLDLGAGTGGHAVLLAERGYEVVAVDRSPEMLARAAAKGAAIELVEADLRRLTLPRRFDAVIAMFAVLGYQVGDDDVRAGLRTVAEHLEPGGTFVADVWYEPAVLSLGPERREREFEAGGERIVRRVMPRHDPAARAVSVEIATRRWRDGVELPRVDETHTVRYFGSAQLSSFVSWAGLELLALTPFPELDREPGADDWSVAVVARRRAGRRRGGAHR